jgi:putative DNA primase/helicase
VQATSLTRLGAPHGTYSLIGKSTALIPDGHVGKFADSTATVENLKSISAQDEVAVEGKFKDEVSLVLRVVIWIFCNDEPDKLVDSSGALAGRYLVWQLTRSFYGEEDSSLRRGVEREGLGIAVWSLAGYARLHASGSPRIEMSDISREVYDEIEDVSSNMVSFARDCLMHDEVTSAKGTVIRRLKFDPDRSVDRDELFKVYENWCKKNGKDGVGRGKLKSRLRPIVNGGLKRGQPLRGDGRRGEVIIGIALRADIDPSLLGLVQSTPSEAFKPRDDGQGELPI